MCQFNRSLCHEATKEENENLGDIHDLVSTGTQNMLNTKRKNVQYV